MKRALMYATVASMIQLFNMENIRLLLEQGYEVDVACNMEQGSAFTSEKIDAMKQELKEMGVNVVHIPIPRKVTAIGDIVKSFRISKQLMNDREYALIHCHSPIGGVICRLANRFSKGYGKTKMIYTAHGFHFFKGAPLKNWLLYYSVEKSCAHFTDVLITMNQEDYALAQKKMKAKRVEYVTGVGIDLTKFRQAAVDKSAKREELGIPKDATLLLSIGELNKNKNHETVIRAIKKLDVYYIIAGKGDLQKHLQDVIDELDLKDRVKLLGYRCDVAELYQASDIYVLPSIREGLNVSVMEAMASGLPVVCSRIRGNTDLIDENGGVLFDPSDVDACAEAIQTLLRSDMRAMGEYNADKIQSFSAEKVNEMMKNLYCSSTMKGSC